ncbi:unnamed protein product [Blepharisma stoltei]|uniref:Uncharacterized protein n=1 Tax=Blepharisma stoltei TaxID=1481888 RepID=A0AAU9K6P9_9CILI|nr:unnamed protein product [Blepharisma stoltei]
MISYLVEIPFKLLLYLALNSQWNLLKNIDTDELIQGECYRNFQSNLELFSSPRVLWDDDRFRIKQRI